MKKHAKLLLSISIILIIISLGLNFIASKDLLSAEKLIYQNVDDNQIHCDYIESQNKKGIIIAGDLTVDKRNYAALISELVSQGYGVFTYDLPSQGTSEGTTSYHYNDDTVLAEQFYNALVVYSQISEIPIEDIHVVGYGQGARIALETASYGYIRPNSLILVGCSINLDQKLNYDIINYSDDIHTDWIESLNDRKFPFSVYMISSAFDDISSEEDNDVLARMIDAEHINTGFAPHFLLGKSPKIIKTVSEIITKIDYLPYESTIIPLLFSISEPLFIISLISSLYFLNYILRNKTKYNTQTIKELPKMPKGFIKKKLCAYGAAIPIGILFGVVIYHLPFITVPYKSLFFICAYTSYGLSLALLYGFTDFGKDLNKPYKLKSEHIYLPFGIFTALLILIAISGAVSSFNPFAIITKWHWMLILTILFAIGFYVDSKEKKSAAFTLKDNMHLSMVNYLMFGLLPILFAVLGLYSNAIISVYNLLYLTAVILFGEILNTLYCPDYLSCILKGFLLQFTVFAQMILFK